MLPIIEGDGLACPYCKPKTHVRLVDNPEELGKVILDVERTFNVRPEADYRLAGLCEKCGTVWLAERVDPSTNKGKPFAWDRFSPPGRAFKR